MGQSREQKMLYAEMLKALQAMQNPKSNPAQEFLSNEALAGADFIKKGEFGKSLPKGLYFDFSMPAEQINQYKKFANVNQGGTFALANQGNEGAKTSAQALQSKYLGDKFARDASQNYQNNISNAYGNIKAGLGQASGYQTSNQNNVMGALQNIYSLAPKKTSPWGAILGAGASIASGFI